MLARILARALLLVLWASSAVLATVSHAQARPPEDFAISSEMGEPLGWQVTRAASAGTSWAVSRLLAYTVDGHQPTRSEITLTVRSAGQRWESLDYRITTGGQERGFRVGLAGGEAHIEPLGRRGPTVTQAIDPALPFAQPELLSGLPVGPFQTLDASRGRIVQREGRLIALAGDPQRQLYLVVEDGRPVDGWVIGSDGASAVALAIRPNFGTPLHFARVAPGTPPRDPPGNARVAHPMIVAPYEVPPPALQGHLRYGFGLPQVVAETLPETPEQAVQTIDGGVRIDVCEQCGAGLPDDPEALARWTRPTPWLQSDDAVIAAAARTARALSDRDAAVMDELARIARRRLADVDFAGHYSASAAWRRRSGDCTEDAVLLAALARAAGIPALVASGFVYTRERYHGTREAFIPHSWVVAFVDGEWRSVDMTLGSFDSSHVALTLGEGDAQSVVASYFIAGLLEWRDMAEVHPRPADQVRLDESREAPVERPVRLAGSSS